MILWLFKDFRGNGQSLLFEAFAIDVLKAARSINDAQGILRLSWHQTQQIMAAAVKRGMDRRDAGETSFRAGELHVLARADCHVGHQADDKDGEYAEETPLWFGCMIGNALAEGFNSTIPSLKASARGYRNLENFRTAILFFCGKLDLRPDFVRIGSTIC